ncbi:carboxypeptidase-like regulatory domain-containing protein [Cupriavidus pinatubonensis]|uniref:carboxypeptidase-like regulatory domain-containing protein n=1 Tax=Cupriavidus pinatubonensis TaxID=248026 RepID=UPI001FD4FA99|nr:carboxypeptidase-like regulatory domain-containing protein [Cupriavidus pinatubonensis]
MGDREMQISKGLGIAISALLAALLVAGCATRTELAEDRVQIMEQRGIPYACARDDEAGRRAMEDVAARFNVRLSMMDAGSARPLSGATVVVTSADGKAVLRIVAGGPRLYMRLKPGAYRLTVGYQGRDQMRDVVVSDQPLDMTFQFKVNTLEDDWLLCTSMNCPCR